MIIFKSIFINNKIKLTCFLNRSANVFNCISTQFICWITSSTDHSAGSTGNLDGPSVGVVEDAASISGSVVRVFFVTNVISSGVELSGEPCRFIFLVSFIITLLTSKIRLSIM